MGGRGVQYFAIRCPIKRSYISLGGGRRRDCNTQVAFAEAGFHSRKLQYHPSLFPFETCSRKRHRLTEKETKRAE